MAIERSGTDLPPSAAAARLGAADGTPREESLLAWAHRMCAQLEHARQLALAQEQGTAARTQPRSPFHALDEAARAASEHGLSPR